MIERRNFIKKTIVLAGSALLPWQMLGQPANASVRIGLVTDSHYADRNPKIMKKMPIRHYRSALEKMKDCVAVFNEQKPDFAIHLGDLKDQDEHPNAAATLSYLKKIEAAFARFQGPRYHCVGNHDVDSITKAQFLNGVENTGIACGKSYYSFEKKGFHFIVLDPNYTQKGQDHFFLQPYEDMKPYIPSIQLEWLEQELRTVNKPTIVFCHQPLFMAKGKGAVRNYEEVIEVLERSNRVVAVFQRHIHKEDYIERGGIHYISIEGMVDYEGMESNAFAIATITNDGAISLEGYRRVRNQKWRAL